MAIPANLSQAGDQIFNQLNQEKSKESSSKRHVLVVDDDGEEEWVKISLKERKPFLDDDDKPIESSVKSEKTSEKPKATRQRKASKTTK